MQFVLKIEPFASKIANGSFAFAIMENVQKCVQKYQSDIAIKK